MQDYHDDEDEVYEVDEKNDELLRNIVTVEDDIVLVDFPGNDKLWQMPYSLLERVVAEPQMLDKYSPNEEAAEFWKENLPTILDIAKEKIELYRSLGFVKW